MPWLQPSQPACVAIFLLIGLALAGCEQPTPPPAEATTVRAIPAQTTRLDNTATLTGQIQSRHESNLSFRIGGKLVERAVEIGQSVKVNDLLARLDDQDQRNSLRSAESEVSSAKAAVEQSRAQEERQRALLANGFTTRVQFDNAQRRYAQAQADLDSAEAKLRNAQDNLSYTELRADRDGVITGKAADAGQDVMAGQMVVQLADPDAAEAVFQVPGASIRLEGNGALPPVEVRLVSDHSQVAEGTIREVSPGVDPVTRTYTIKVSLPNAPRTFLLGAAVTGRAKLPARPVVSLPASALFETIQGAPAVWVVAQPAATVSLRPVSILQFDTGTVTISKGLDDGELVVIGGVQKLRPGQKVAIAQGEGA